MLIESTKKMIDVVFDTDPTLKPDMKERVIAILSGRETSPIRPECLVVSRGDAAKMLNMTPHRVDDYCRQGILKRVKFPGSKIRSSGILRSSIEEAVMSAIG